MSLQEKLGIIEVYLPIDGFDNYEVSNYGNVRNKTTNKILKPQINHDGYSRVELKRNEILSVHRLVASAFLLNPENKKCVDHIDNNRQNNEVFNLRWATNQENQFNKSLTIRNTSGYKGVSWMKAKNMWRSRIQLNGKDIHLGCFDNIEDAIKARRRKAHELFGEFINNCEVN